MAGSKPGPSKVNQSCGEMFQKSTLGNGIRVVTEHMPFVRSISLGVWIEAGSRDENRENSGISHFIEHMAFKGTENRGAREIAESLEEVGGHLNAFTSKELSCYGAHVLDEYLPLAVDVLSDILMYSVFDKGEIEKEKQVVLKEIDHYKEAPDEMVFERFYENMYPDHPLGYLIYGMPETIASFKRADILDYLARDYTQGRIVVAAAGNVSHDELRQLVDERFSGFPSFVPPRRVQPTATARDMLYHDTCAQAHICTGTWAYPYKEAKKFPLLILDTILGAGMSSRLFQNVRERHGVAYSIYSFADFYSDTGLFGVYLAADPEQTDNCLELVDAEFQRVRREPLKEEEMERAKSQLKGNLVLGLESSASRMTRLARMEIYLKDYCSVDDALKHVEAVSSRDVQEVAAELFSDGNLHTTQLQPNKDAQ